MLGRTRSRGSLIVQNRKTVNEEVDGLDIAGPRGQPSVILRHTKSSHVYSVSTQTLKRLGPDAEAVKPGSRCYWQGLSTRMESDVGDESTESRSVLQSLRIPSVICPVRCTSVVVVNMN